MDVVKPVRCHGPFSGSAFNKGKAELSISGGNAVTNEAVEAIIAGVPKAIRFPDDWDVKVAKVTFLASFENIELAPGQDLSDVMEVVRDPTGLEITVDAIQGQTHLVPVAAQEFMSAFNYFAVLGSGNQDGDVSVTVFLAAQL